MAPLGANVVPAHEGLPACVPAGRGGEGARQLVRALAAGTVANLRQRTRRACPVVTDDVAEMVLALLFSAALVVALPHWVGASALLLVTATLAELHADLFTRGAVARVAWLRARVLAAIQ